MIDNWRPRLVFWVSWVLASTLSILIAFALLYGGIFLAKAIFGSFNEDRLFGWLMFPILALLIGASQWLILRGTIPRAWLWIPATVAGLSLGVTVAGFIVQAYSNQYGFRQGAQAAVPLVFTLMGFILGVFQLPVILRHLRWWSLWLVSNTIGWLALGLLVGKSIDRSSDIIALGLIPSIFAGASLAWQLRIQNKIPINQPESL